MPFSVTIADIYKLGVTSKAGFAAVTPVVNETKKVNPKNSLSACFLIIKMTFNNLIIVPALF